MSQRREYAGKLNSEVIGKQVEVTYHHGNIESTVRDMLVKVLHTDEGVRLFFRGTEWKRQGLGLFADNGDLGLLVTPLQSVIVKDDS